MSKDHSDDLIAQVVDAFERMSVPPAPTLRETLDLVERVAGAPPKMLGGSRHRPTFRFARLTVKQRFAAAGVGLSAAAGVMALLLTLNSGGQLSAMQRLARELRDVTSYSYRESSHVTSVDRYGKPSTTWDSVGSADWLAPGAFREEMKVIKTEPAIPPGNPTEELLVHFAQIFPADKPGILIDHIDKTFRRLLSGSTGSRTYPSDRLRMIRENSGRVTRDLGTMEIRGKPAHGYLMAFPHDASESRGLDAVDVWLDPETDLPLEFGYAVRSAAKSTVWQATDFRWNRELDPALFTATPPAGYSDITPPDKDREFSQITAALELYARLSGGHYPRVAKFDAAAIRGEMAKMAGFVGPPKAEWNDDKTFLEIQEAAAGLDWIAKILRNRDNSGYRGIGVTPADKDKVLLWWLVDDDCFRVFYGDLRMQLLTEAAWDRLTAKDPPTDAPGDDQKPGKRSTAQSFAIFAKALVDARSAAFQLESKTEGQEKETLQSYYLSPGKMRSDMPGFVQIIDPTAGKILNLFPQQKTAELVHVKFMGNDLAKMGSMDMFEHLRGMLADSKIAKDDDYTELGEREIEGRRVLGFRYGSPLQSATFWGDPATGSPVLVELQWNGFPRSKTTMSHFEFNTTIDPALFDVTPPADYKVREFDLELNPAEETLIASLRTLSDWNDGVFLDRLDGASLQALLVKKANADKPAESIDAAPELKTEYLPIGVGMTFALELPESADAHYAGKGVKRGEPDRPIFWYKPEGTKTYRVIYADLSAKDAAAAPEIAGAVRLEKTKPVEKPEPPKLEP